MKSRIVLLAAAISVALTGCAGITSSPSSSPTPSASSSSAEAVGSSTNVPGLGTDRLEPDTAGLTILVVGDSLARALGAGMIDVNVDKKYTVINAAIGGCGIMLSTSRMINGQLQATPDECNMWPTAWPELIDQYHPDVVYLTTAFWEVAPQAIDDSGVLQTFDDEAFRDTYNTNVDRALAILTAGGASVFMDDMNADGMHNAQPDAVARNSDENVHLLHLRGELCSDTNCPTYIDGIQVLDETGHPAGESRNRLARWILNAMAAEISGK